MEKRAIKVGMAVWVLAAGAAWGQGAPAKMDFEVASVRPAQTSGGPDQVQAGLRMDGSQAHFAALSVKNLIARAYDVQQSEISGPDWISSVRYDINAKLPDGATTDQIPQMLQSLLAERFGLKFHRESKEMPAYAIVLGKPPLKLKETPPDSEPAPDPKVGVSLAVTGSAAGVAMDLGHGSSFALANDQFNIKKLTMDQVAVRLAQFLDRPVVNLTKLTGNYDFTLPVTREDYYILLVRSGANAGVSMPPQAMGLLSAGPPSSLFDSIDQLGLHMDSRKMPLDTIVVDQALQTPTEN